MNEAQRKEALRLAKIIEPELPDVTEREGVWCFLRGGDSRAVYELLRTLAEQQEQEQATRNLPDDIRVPLHTLWADAGYLVGRAVEGERDLVVYYTAPVAQPPEPTVPTMIEALIMSLENQAVATPNASVHDLLGSLGYVRAYTPVAQQQHEPDTVPWPVVSRYYGGASPEGVAGRVWIRLGDGPEEKEYAPVAQPLTDAARDVLAERRRQVEAEGYDTAHDDEHDNGSLAAAGSAYALAAADALHPLSQGDGDFMSHPPTMWPWDAEWWKPGDPHHMLVKAGALILAEIERLDRAILAAAGAKP